MRSGNRRAHDDAAVVVSLARVLYCMHRPVGLCAVGGGTWAVGRGTRLTVVVINAASSEVELGELGRVSPHQAGSLGAVQCRAVHMLSVHGRAALTVLPSSPQSEPELYRTCISSPHASADSDR
jgi:hypothetical protein